MFWSVCKKWVANCPVGASEEGVAPYPNWGSVTHTGLVGPPTWAKHTRVPAIVGVGLCPFVTKWSPNNGPKVPRGGGGASEVTPKSRFFSQPMPA